MIPSLGTILRGLADELAADPGLWAPGTWLGHDENRLIVSDPADLDGAVTLSLSGVLYAALYGHRTWDGSNALFRAHDAILDAAKLPRTAAVGAWEDRPGRSVPEIVDVLRIAAVLCDVQDADLRRFHELLAAA